MSNGYLATADIDVAGAQAIAQGFGLEVVQASRITDLEAAAAELAAAANLGILLSVGAAKEDAFVALLQALAAKAPRAQLILVEPEARDAFSFLPAAWPAMAFDEAQRRAAALSAPPAPQAETGPEPEPQQPEPAEPAKKAAPPSDEAASPPPGADAPAPADDGAVSESGSAHAEAPAQEEAPMEAAEAPAPALEPEPELPTAAEPAPEPEPPPVVASEPAPPAPAQMPAPAPAAPPPAASPAPQTRAPARDRGAAPARSAPADATAFAPKKLRRATPELVRIVMHQPKDLAAVIKAARKIDPSASPAPQGMTIGEVALGASVGVSLEVRGATCDGTVQRRTWAGAPIDFAFTVEADADARQAVLIARVFIDDAQIGVIAFTRPIAGPAKKPAAADRVRLKRHKRVFLSYSSHDRETVSAIATAYRMAGVEHFWDRASLKSGEEWSPRLRREIERADLFHLCWSKSAAASEWVEKETLHALNRRRRIKRPDITVQMLDGPPWAPHPQSLDSINFDDFVRAAIVGYARGEG